MDAQTPTTRVLIGFPGAQKVKNLSPMQETRVQSLGGEDPLGQGKATHSTVFLPGESHGQRSLVGYSPQCRKELEVTGTVPKKVL